jgi:hypothetical protein
VNPLVIAGPRPLAVDPPTAASLASKAVMAAVTSAGRFSRGIAATAARMDATC